MLKNELSEDKLNNVIIKLINTYGKLNTIYTTDIFNHG